jgi:hypothetical protein
MVYPFSCHNYQLRYWLAASGVDPDRDVQLVVIPPPLMADALQDVLEAVLIGTARSREEGFLLATVKGKSVDQSDWPQVFGELTGQYLELGARIAATPMTSDRIKDLVAKADAARRQGQLDEAGTLLVEATDLALRDAAQEPGTRECRRPGGSRRGRAAASVKPAGC